MWWYVADGSGTHAGGLPSYQPPSVLASLCSQLGDDCWIQIPTLFNDASVETLATQVAQNLKPGLKWFVEWSNEIMGNWNYQSNWAYLEGAALNFPQTGVPGVSGSSGDGEVEWDYYAYRRLQIMNDVKTAWVAAGRSLNDLVFMETDSDNDSPAVVEALRLQGYDLTFQSNGQYCSGSGCTITTAYNTSPNRPVDTVITGLSYAPYTNGSYFQSATLWGSCGGPSPNGLSVSWNWAGVLDAADNYTTGVNTGNQTLINSALSVMDADLRGGYCGTTAFMGTITNAAGTGPGTVLNVSAIEPYSNPQYSVVPSSNALTAANIASGTEISALGAAGCTPTGSGGTGCYTVSASSYVPTPELMVIGGPQQTVLYHESVYPGFDTLVAKYPQIEGIWQYEGGFEVVTPAYNALTNIGLFQTPNCPMTTFTGSASIATTAGAPTSTPTQMVVTWNGGQAAPMHYDTITFSQGGGGITAGTPYFWQAPASTASGTGSISGNTLDMMALPTGTIGVGDLVVENGALSNMAIETFGTGGTTGTGGTGTYAITGPSQTVTSHTVNFYAPTAAADQGGDNNWQFHHGNSLNFGDSPHRYRHWRKQQNPAWSLHHRFHRHRGERHADYWKCLFRGYSVQWIALYRLWDHRNL